MTYQEKIKHILKISEKVIRDAALENGAIVAANTDKKYYDRHAKNYHYVWPRDAAYICVAAKLIGINDIQEPYFDWLLERPEDFKKESTLYQHYSTNGRKAGKQYQPDQAGTTLWAIWEIYNHDPNQASKYEALIRRLADGLTEDWHGKYFFKNSADLWENWYRRTSTKVENNYTYTLAACARGLLCAHAIFKNSKWEKAANEMINLINEAYLEDKEYFLRNHGIIDDLNIDASVLGLAWPFEIIEAKDERFKNTIKKIEEELVFDGGVKRFQFDYYDGEGTSGEGGGAWPICNFWMSLAYIKAGNEKMAKHYFKWVVDRIKDDGMIAEQIFVDYRQGIKPLAWSHAMFIFAAKELGYLT